LKADTYSYLFANAIAYVVVFGLIFLSTGFGHSNQKSIFLNSWDSMLSYLFLIYLPPARYYGF